MRFFSAVLLTALVFPASAQMVYKCVAENGHVTLTSTPCEADQKEAAAVYAPPERMTQQRYNELQRRRRQDEANSRYLETLARGSGVTRGAVHAPTSTPTKDARCQAAKRRRAALREAAGMKVSFLTIRRLDEAVYAACK